jgi:hypothetical protein
VLALTTRHRPRCAQKLPGPESAIVTPERDRDRVPYLCLGDKFTFRNDSDATAGDPLLVHAQ